MQAAFLDAMSEASHLGSLNMIVVFFRELRDMPTAVFTAWWRLIRKTKKEFGMTDILNSDGFDVHMKPSLMTGRVPGTWREALLSGLPHGIIAIILTVVSFITRNQTGDQLMKIVEITALAFVWSMGAFLIFMLFIAWRQGWPRWAGSYYLYGFLVVSMPLLLLLQNYDTEWAYRGMDILMSLGYIVLLMLWVIIITQRDAIKGLLMFTPIVVLSWWLVLEFVPNGIRNPNQVGMFMVTALAAVLIARVGSWRGGIWIMVVASMVVGIPISYYRTYHHQIPPEHSEAATLGVLSGRFTEATFWSALLVIGPLLMWVMREIGLRSGKKGRLAYHLMIYGLLANLAVNLMVDRSYSYGWLRHNPGREVLSGVVIVITALVYLAGVFLLLRSSRSVGLFSRWTRFALGGAAFGLPFMFMFPMFDSRRYASTSLPFGLFYENQVPDILVYGLGTLWLLAGGWLITRLRVPAEAATEVVEAKG